MLGGKSKARRDGPAGLREQNNRLRATDWGHSVSDGDEIVTDDAEAMGCVNSHPLEHGASWTQSRALPLVAMKFPKGGTSRN